ncbi:MAG: GspE/PulE family protein [Phycisphaerae bacterium]
MIAAATRKPLGQLLIDAGVISQEQLERALDEQRRHNHLKLLGEVLIEQRICQEDQIVEALAKAYGVPYAKITPKLADPKAIGLLPKEFLEKNAVLPLFSVQGMLTVAVPEPANVFLLEEIERLSGQRVQVVAATVHDIKATLQTYLPNDRIFVIDEVIGEVRPDDFALIEDVADDIADLEELSGDSPVVKLVNYCIYNAVKEGASDIHLEPGEQSLRVRYRIDGRLVERLRPPSRMQAAVASRVKIMAGLDIAERRLPQDGGIHVMMDKRPVDLRVSTMPSRHGEKVVIRVIDNERVNANLEKLGFGYETLKAWRKLILRPNGILLVTGPTGSGKSTTLYAALEEVNKEDVNISTVEDPIEYVLRGINQTQVNERAGLTFTGALRALLRQDPDILMIGEVRDVETARLATQAALTGHLVFSTLHTNDAPSAVTRLYNLGIEPYLVGATIQGVLAQRLVRKLCTHCREAYEPPPQEKRHIEREAGAVEVLYRAKGCAKCHGRGYAGRVGIYELFVPDDVISEKIAAGVTLNEIRDLAIANGMRTLRQDGLEKIRSGMTTLEEIHRVTA